MFVLLASPWAALCAASAELSPFKSTTGSRACSGSENPMGVIGAILLFTSFQVPVNGKTVDSDEM